MRERKGGSGRKPARRGPPPEATGRETDWYRELAARGTSVVVRTVAGESFRGPISEFDESMIVVESEGEGAVRIRTEAIRSIAED